MKFGFDGIGLVALTRFSDFGLHSFGNSSRDEERGQIAGGKREKKRLMQRIELLKLTNSE